MSKFKVGDRVVDSSVGVNCQGHWNEKFKDYTDKESEKFFTVVDVCSEYGNKINKTNDIDHGFWVNDQTIILVSSSVSSPIRTVTRKEIVAGVYGKVCINEKGDGTGLDYIQMLGTLDPAELREAAHTLNQIAEVLEENAD